MEGVGLTDCIKIADHILTSMPVRSGTIVIIVSALVATNARRPSLRRRRLARPRGNIRNSGHARLSSHCTNFARFMFSVAGRSVRGWSWTVRMTYTSWDLPMSETSRVRDFRTSLAKQIPKFPNNKASLQALKAKSIGELLVDYTNWAIRYIAPRPRQVVVESAATNDQRWSSLGADIREILRKVEAGINLTPHLSQLPHTRGFTPAASAQGPNADRWADKDMLLNVTGYHHLHLDAAPTKGKRSNDVVFAQVTRTTFTVVGIFDYSVFKPTMTPERMRLWEIFDERMTRGLRPGTIVAPLPIANSGHRVQLRMMAANYARTVLAIDPILDDPSYVLGQYEKAGVPVTARPKLRWQMHFLDLCLVDNAENTFVVSEGPN